MTINQALRQVAKDLRSEQKRGARSSAIDLYDLVEAFERVATMCETTDANPVPENKNKNSQ